MYQIVIVSDADVIFAIISFTLQNSKPLKDNLSKDERKSERTRYIIYNLPADKGKSTVTLNRKNYLKKYMDNINIGPYQLFKAGLLPSEKKCVVCFIESPPEMMKNAFYFILKALFVLKMFKFLSWLFGHEEETA